MRSFFKSDRVPRVLSLNLLASPNPERDRVLFLSPVCSPNSEHHYADKFRRVENVYFLFIIIFEVSLTKEGNCGIIAL